MRINQDRDSFKTFSMLEPGTTQTKTTQALFDEFKANYKQSSKNFRGLRTRLSLRTGATTAAITFGTAWALQTVL